MSLKNIKCPLHNSSFHLNCMTNSGENYFQHCLDLARRDREECGGIPAHQNVPGQRFDWPRDYWLCSHGRHDGPPGACQLGPPVARGRIPPELPDSHMADTNRRRPRSGEASEGWSGGEVWNSGANFSIVQKIISLSFAHEPLASEFSPIALG
jgi:hypothetical protein